MDRTDRRRFLGWGLVGGAAALATSLPRRAAAGPLNPAVSIQSRIDAVVARGGGIVDVPPGVHQENVFVPLRATAAPIWIRGSGDATVWRRDPSVASPLLDASETASLRVTDLVLEIVPHEGPSPGVGPPAPGVLPPPTGIFARRCEDLTLERVHFRGKATSPLGVHIEKGRKSSSGSVCSRKSARSSSGVPRTFW